MMKGRTVAVLITAAVLLSSGLTYIVMDTAVDTKLVSYFQSAGAEDRRQTATNESESMPDGYDKIKNVHEIIKSSYLEEVDDQQLINGAVQGMLQSLDDPYSVYMDPQAAEKFNESAVESSFEGIGAEVTMKNGRVTIVSPFKGSPAEQAGLKPNDQIIKVNGESLEGLDLYEAVLKIRGPEETKAKLEIMRPGVNDPLEITVLRDEIPIETVYPSMIQENEDSPIGKIEITQFSKDTANDFKTALNDLEERGAQGLILDVRGNPGGMLDSVLNIAKQVVPNEGIILQIEGNQGEKKVYASDLGEARMPIAVLVDNGSASASEILAASLKQSGYPVIGQTTYGKGTVQNTVPLGDQSQLKLSIAKWLTPNGKWIHEKGVKPTISVEQPEYFQVPSLPQETLTKGMNQSAVKHLEVMLKGLGYSPGSADGYFDEKTQTAVEAFQNVQELQVTGKVNEKTRTKLQGVLLEKLENLDNDLQLQTAIEALEQKLDSE